MDATELAELRQDWGSCLRSDPSCVDVAFAELVQRYSEPTRHYHNFAHIAKVVPTAVSLMASMKLCPLIHAAFLHDVIYNTRANDNEERSAEFAGELLAGLSVNRDIREEVARLILLTKTHETSRNDPPGCALLDADLAILAAPPAEYDAYAAAIRREYDWVPEAQFRRGRRGVLERFLARPTIYRTEQMRPQEPLARANLAREIASLS